MPCLVRATVNELHVINKVSVILSAAQSKDLRLALTHPKVLHTVQ